MINQERAETLSLGDPGCCQGVILGIVELVNRTIVCCDGQLIAVTAQTQLQYRDYTGTWVQFVLVQDVIANLGRTGLSTSQLFSCNGTCWFALWTTNSNQPQLDLFSIDTSGSVPTLIHENNGQPVLAPFAGGGGTYYPPTLTLFCCSQTPGTLGIVASYRTTFANLPQALVIMQYTQHSPGYGTTETIELLDSYTQNRLLAVNGSSSSPLTITPACGNQPCRLVAFDQSGNLSIWSDFNFTNQTASYCMTPWAPIGANLTNADNTLYAIETTQCDGECVLATLLPGSAFLSLWRLGFLPVLEPEPIPSSCLCRIIKAACDRGSYVVAARLYQQASPVDRACLCDQLSTACAATLLVTAAGNGMDPVLPGCPCDERLASIITLALLETNNAAIIEQLVRETVASGYCCNLVPTLLTSLVQACVPHTKLCLILQTALDNNCYTNLICDWFTAIVREPCLGSPAASTLLARMLSDTTYCSVGSQVLNQLCCACESSIDFTNVITDALAQVRDIFGSPLPPLNCA